MKIIASSLFRSNLCNLKFGKIVDYGAQDKDLVYVPILFEEPDSFEKSPVANTNNLYADEKVEPKSKIKKLIQGAGATIATAEVVPEVVGGLCDKGTNVINSVENFANKTIDSAASIKENFKDKFGNKQNTTTNDTCDSSNEVGQCNSNDSALTPFANENKSNNPNVENESEQDNIDETNGVTGTTDIDNQDVEDEDADADVDDYGDDV